MPRIQFLDLPDGKFAFLLDRADPDLDVEPFKTFAADLGAAATLVTTEQIDIVRRWTGDTIRISPPLPHTLTRIDCDEPSQLDGPIRRLGFAIEDGGM